MPERHDDGPVGERKPAVKTTIVGGQPDAEPDLRTVPVGLETLLAMAAVDEAFAGELLEDPDRARRASGVTLTATEEQILRSVDRDALVLMIARVGDRLPGRSRRAFLKKSAAALLAIVGGAALSSCDGGFVATTGAAADLPRPAEDSPRRWLEISAGENDSATTILEDFPDLTEGKATSPVAIYFHAEKHFGVSPEEAEFEGRFSESRELKTATRGYRRFRCWAGFLPAAILTRHDIRPPCILVCTPDGKQVLRIDSGTEDFAAAASRLQEILREPTPPTHENR